MGRTVSIHRAVDHWPWAKEGQRNCYSRGKKRADERVEAEVKVSGRRAEGRNETGIERRKDRKELQMKRITKATKLLFVVLFIV
jgi:hypothetical protein